MNQAQNQYELDQSQIIKQIQKLNWSDLLQSPIILPTNPYYQLKHPQQYSKYYSLFRKVLQSQQISQRSFILTTLILYIRSSNYYALMLRKKYYFKQQYQVKRIHTQLHYINCLLNNNTKEYQLWTYKKQIFNYYLKNTIEEKQLYQREVQFIQYCFELDNKNYHAWDYLLWIVTFYHQESKQIQRTQSLLYKDNKIAENINTALEDSNFKVVTTQWKKCYPLWSYRYNLLKIKLKQMNTQDRQTLQRQQLQKIDNWIRLQQNRSNQQPWNYLLGILFNYSIINQSILIKYSQFALQSYLNNNKNRFAGNAYLQICDFLSQKYNITNNRRQEIIKKLIQSDKVRQLYYNYLLTNQK